MLNRLRSTGLWFNNLNIVFEKLGFVGFNLVWKLAINTTIHIDFGQCCYKKGQWWESEQLQNINILLLLRLTKPHNIVQVFIQIDSGSKSELVRLHMLSLPFSTGKSGAFAQKQLAHVEKPIPCKLGNQGCMKNIVLV